MNNIIKNKARGSLVGLVVGDILGAPVEFGCTSAAIREYLDQLKDFHDNHILKKGVYTDDTSMALCLTDSLIEKQGYDSYDVMDKYLAWEDHGFHSYFDYGYGEGGQVADSLMYYRLNPVVEKSTPRVWNAGNGAIMRLAPALIAAAGDQTLKDSVRLASLSARETHYSEVAEAATEAFANFLYRALHATEDADKPKIISLDDLYFTREDFRETWADNRWLLTGRLDSDGECLTDLGGFIIDAITIALWGFKQAEDFEDGMLKVLRLGGDTDTNCAIYGQLAGAYYGYDNIPSRWTDNMAISKDTLCNLSDRLLTLPSCPIIITRFEEDKEFKKK